MTKLHCYQLRLVVPISICISDIDHREIKHSPEGEV